MILFTEKIASAININEWRVKNALDLLNGGATIPFIARYRKEQTGELTDIQLIEIDKLYKILVALAERKEAILKSLKERNLLTSELENKIINSQTQTELEDVYLPFKPKRKTRATIAIDKGLEPLAKMIMSENVSSLDAVARKYISEKQEVNSTEDALQGARDIIAEWISEKDFVRNYIRGQFQRSAELISKQNKKNSDDGNKYESYYDWQEKAGRAPAHRLLAMFRGENEGLLKLKILPDIDFVYSHLENKIIRNNNEAADQKKIALIDSIKSLLLPSLDTE